MQRLIINTLALLLTVSFFQCGCTNQKSTDPFFPGEYPGEASFKLSGNSLILFNDAIEEEWGIADNSVFLKKVTNKFDGLTVNLDSIILFAIEMDGGRQLTNVDFKLKAPPEKLNLEATDTVPTKALRFPGREISVSMVAEDKDI